MPANNVSEAQAAKIVAYLRSLAESRRSVAAAGDAMRGKSIFDGKGACATCHRVNGNGSRLGPDLSRIGQVRRTIELEQSLIEPSAEVLPANRSYRVTTRDGATVTGRLLNHDTFTVQLLDSKEQLRSFLKADLMDFGFAPTPMPSYKGTLDAQETADVVSYLVSLKGSTNP
jgi:quinoprotein glucose dehydrogenase